MGHHHLVSPLCCLRRVQGAADPPGAGLPESAKPLLKLLRGQWRESAGKRGSGRTRKGNRYLRMAEEPFEFLGYRIGRNYKSAHRPRLHRHAPEQGERPQHRPQDQ